VDALAAITYEHDDEDNDLLHLDDEDLTYQPLVERKHALNSLALAGPSWVTNRWYPGDSDDLLAVCVELGHEGVVAKRLDSVYRSGVFVERGPPWSRAQRVTLGIPTDDIPPDHEAPSVEEVGAANAKRRRSRRERANSTRRSRAASPARTPGDGPSVVAIAVYVR
jgi:hypothetical protein